MNTSSEPTNEATQASWNERDIFLAASDIEDPAERNEFLDQTCAGDSTIRRRINKLLDQSVGAGFLEDRPAGLSLTLANFDANADIELEPRIDFLTPSDKPGCLGTLGHYEIVSVVGRGGFGVVFRAYDTKLNRVVAIKAMAPEIATNRMAVQRFSREAQAAAAVTHEHVITLHAIDEGSQPPFIVMEFIEGESLAERIEREGALPPIEIVRIGMQIAAGLRAAHELGMVHRDIKPANILLENGVRRVKITDFGLARAVDDIGMTQTGTIAGTPQYMSPEQGLGHSIDARSDLFSLGSVLYTLCTGRAPFRADSTVATLKRVCDETPRKIREVNPDIPIWLERIVMKLLEKRPDDRVQSAAEVEELFRSYLAAMQSDGGSNWAPPKNFQRSKTVGKHSHSQEVAALLLAPLIVFQMMAMVGSFIAAWIDVESILLTGPAFGIVLGGLIAGLAIHRRANWQYAAFGLSSILLTALITFLINHFNWTPSDEEPILILIVTYSMFAIPWGLLILRRGGLAAPRSELWQEVLESPHVLIGLLSLQTIAIALSAALLHIEEESIFVTLPLFFLLLGMITALKVLRNETHRLTKVFAVSSPLAALLIFFSIVSYSNFAKGTAVEAFGVFAIFSLVTAYAMVAVPLGLWCVATESKLFDSVRLGKFSIQSGLSATALLASAFAFARPSLNFGGLAFVSSSLLGVALFSIAIFYAYWFYREQDRAVPVRWFATAVATVLLAISFMLVVHLIDQSKNHYVLLLDLQEVTTSNIDMPITFLITETATGEVHKVHAMRHQQSLGTYRVGQYEIELAEQELGVKIEQPKLNFSRGNRYVKLVKSDTDVGNSGSMTTLPSAAAEIDQEPVNAF